jgi:sugar phosphate isomerase/epimerase
MDEETIQMKVAVREDGFEGNAALFPIEMVFNQIAELGYDGVEIRTFPEDQFGAIPWTGRRRRRGIWAEDLDKAARVRLRALAESAGLAVSSLSTAWVWPFSELNPLEHWDRGVEILKKDIELSSDLGAGAILMHMGATKGTWDQIKIILCELAQEAERFGVRLGFESNLWHRLGLGELETLMDMLEEIGNDYLGVYHHSRYPRAGLPPEEEVRLIGQRLVGVHSGLVDQSIDYESYFQALNDVGYDGYWVFEVKSESIIECKQAWDALMARYG